MHPSWHADQHASQVPVAKAVLPLVAAVIRDRGEGLFEGPQAAPRKSATTLCY